MSKVKEMSENTKMNVAPKGWSCNRIGAYVMGYRGGASLKPEDFTSEGVKILSKLGVQKGGKLKIGEDKLKYCSREYSIINGQALVSNEYIITVLRDLVPSGPSIGLIVKIPNNECFLMAQGVYGLKLDNSRIDEDFLIHHSNSDDFRKIMRRILVGSTQVHIRLPEYLDVILSFPPHQEQRKIAKILTTVDNLIEKTQTLIDKFQSIKQGMMHDLFTRGVDENGKLRPTYEEAPHLYKESELGWIPKEWEVKALQDVTEKIQDGTHFSPQTSDGEFLYVTSKNIRFGYMDISNCERISKSEHDLIYKRCDVKLGDILLTKDGANTGNATINTVFEPFSLLSSVAFIRCNPDLSAPNFVVQYLLSPIGQNRLKELMSGNAITRLTLTKINGFKILVPPTNEQEQIGECLKTFDKTVLSEKEQLSKYAQIKSGLMQDLLTGKVRVKIDELEEEVVS